MKRKRGFFIALGSAAATFGILFATLGKPQHCAAQHRHCHNGHATEHHHNK